jgi:hypothetical protein
LQEAISSAQLRQIAKAITERELNPAPESSNIA